MKTPSRPLSGRSSPVFLSAVLFSSVSLMSCGKNPLITDVKFRNQEVSGEVHLELKAQLGLPLPELIPVVLPIAHAGTLTVHGKNVTLKVNATDALRLHSCDPTKLPNQTALPISAAPGLQVACIPIGGSDSRVYLAFNGRQWLAGFALALKMDSPVKLPVNVILPVPLGDPDLQAMGGMFFGQPSGLAVFALHTDPQGGSMSLLADGDRISGMEGEIRLRADTLTNRRKDALRDAYYSHSRPVAVD